MQRTIEEIINGLPAPDRSKYLKAALKETYESSLFSLCKSGLGYKDVTRGTHKDTIECLESRCTRKLLCLPRGSLKSSIACVGYPVWKLIRDPNERILITSELYTNSKTFVREIKMHLESQKFVDIFGSFRGELWNEGEILIRQRTKRLKEASVTAGGIGTTKVGQHYTTIICDDLNSPDNTNNHENAEKTLMYFKYLISILEPGGTLVVIGTRYAQNDVIGSILENEEIEGHVPGSY